MSIDEGDDALRLALEDPGPHVDDGGFTERVMESLPEARPVRRRRTAIFVGSGVLAAGVLALSPVLPFLGEISRRALASGHAPLSAVVVALSLITALFSTGVYASLPE
jgi:hypothetical protein